MGNISIAETGIRYVWECLREYWGPAIPFLIYFALGMIWTAADRKQKEARVFWYYTVFLALTVYNPLAVKILIPRIVEESVYYRFFWALPALIGAAYYLVRLVEQCPKKWMKGAATVAAVALICGVSSVNGNVIYNLDLPSNFYKVPDEVLDICTIIHEDYQGEGEPKVVIPDQMSFYIRQYDPSLYLVIDRNTLLYYEGSNVVGDLSGKNTYKRRARILDALRSVRKVSVKKFRKSLKKTGTQYLVVPRDYTSHDYLKKAGCELFAEDSHYYFYRFDPESVDA